MKRTHLAALAIITVFSACSSDDTGGPDAEVFTATLSGAAEVPPKTSTGTGTGKITINSNRTISYDLTVSGLTNITAQHIHGPASESASAGVLVPVSIGLNQVISSTTPNLNVSYDSLVSLIRAGKTYFNVHTAANQGGEIRGNIRSQ